MLLFFLALLAALQTPAPIPRLALVIGRANQAVMQPSFERFSNDAATRFASRFSVVAVPVPGDERPQHANLSLCNSLGVVGFLVPARHWHTMPTAVSATVRLVIIDCAGNRFFDDTGDFAEPRSETTIPQTQIESAASGATAVVLAKFATFVSRHQELWSRFLATGNATSG
ncbi:MAG TPA: hypothetical protein VMG98_10020 [Verrucomicrobiae bacterium]|nr:hypothetical protein [Verrucomicrobiae bacterium]